MKPDVLQEHQRDIALQHARWKCAPFSELSLNRIPLLAMTPDRIAPRYAAERQMSVCPYSFLNP